jgi:hypothetical protein
MAMNEALDHVPLDGRLGSAAMEGSTERGVTPEGVRAGDRAALAALVERRGPAVVAFCTQVCGPQMADRAAAEAFARFRAAVRDAPDLKALHPEALLRGATRHAAASLARQPSGPPPHGKLRSRGTQTCQHVPTMLAARANGALGGADLDRLARHLERCERCDALGEIFRRAELAYQDPVVDTLGTDTTSVLIDALLAVSEVGHGVAPAPAADAPPVGEALEGAFPHLPDLDDEVPIVVEVPPVPAPELVAVEALPGEVADPEADGEDDEDFGGTSEWDNELPDGVAPPEVAADGEPAPLLTGGHTRRTGRPRPLVILLPILLVLAIAAGAAGLAGFFNGDDGAATVSKPLPPQVQAPVTTPLPIKLKAKATTPAASTASAASGSVASSSSAPANTDAVGTTP